MRVKSWTYLFPFGKSKKKKIIEDQGQKQIRQIGDNTNAIDYKNELLISKEAKIFKSIYTKKLDKIEELSNKVNYDDLKLFTGSST